MVIINQSSISYSLGLDLFGRSKIDTQQTSLNVVSVSSLLTFEKSPPKHYLISRIIYLFIIVFVRNSKEYEIVALDEGQPLLFKACSLNTISRDSGDLQHSKEHITFSFLNYVNINSFQSYSLSTFILFVFLFLGLEYNGHNISMKCFVWFLFLMDFSVNTSFWFQTFLVLLTGDAEINSGPKRTFKARLSICHWNLNSVSAHNYVKLSLLREYLVFHKFGIICLSQTYLNSSNSSDDETLEISGYNLVHSDHPLNSKRGGVFTTKIIYPYELSVPIIYQNV